MCLHTISDGVPAEENFQNIRYKYLRKVAAFQPSTIEYPCPTPTLEFSFPLDNGSHKAKIGKLYIENRFGPLQSDRGVWYPMGFHYFVKRPEWGGLTEIEVRPVLMSGVHVMGTQEIFMPANENALRHASGLRHTQPRTGVASMVYFLTDEEEKFLKTNHRPVHIYTKDLWLEPNEV